MWKAVVCFTLLYSFVYVRSYVGMIGVGRWTVLDVQLCEDPDQYEMLFECSRNKLNRTHDGFNAFVNLKKEINERDYGILIDIYKEVDGGWKYYQKMSEESFCNFTRKYAKDNLEKALSMANVDPPDCPIKPGEYTVKGYMFDYGQLPDKAIYGKFKVYAYLIHNMEKVGCIVLVVEFKENDDGDDYDD